jgi:hypothetical protein
MFLICLNTKSCMLNLNDSQVISIKPTANVKFRMNVVLSFYTLNSFGEISTVVQNLNGSTEAKCLHTQSHTQ